MNDWIRLERAVRVRDVTSLLPPVPGKYAFFVRELTDLPKGFHSEAMSREIPRLLYIGKADRNLFVRVWEQECQHKRPGTFFRSVGAMLGYQSPRGGKNYEFAVQDKKQVVEWIADRLLVAWDVKPIDGSHVISEKALIRQYAPLLNIAGNPLKFRELERLRAICRTGNT